MLYTYHSSSTSTHTSPFSSSNYHLISHPTFLSFILAVPLSYLLFLYPMFFILLFSLFRFPPLPTHVTFHALSLHLLSLFLTFFLLSSRPFFSSSLPTFLLQRFISLFSPILLLSFLPLSSLHHPLYLSYPLFSPLFAITLFTFPTLSPLSAYFHLPPPSTLPLLTLSS